MLNTFNIIDRRTGETWLDTSDSTVNTVSMTYDAIGNLLAASDDYSSYTFTYDGLNRLETSNNAVSVPRTAFAEAEGFIGPTIGRSGYRSIVEFEAAVHFRYQQLVNQGYANTMDLVRRGLVKNNPTVIGTEVDTFARTGLRDWLRNVEGLQEGSGSIIRGNRRLYDPAGSGAYRIPDVYIPGARSIFDATIAEKTIFLPQTIDFRAFSGGGNVTITRPSALVTPDARGSYG